MHNRAISINLIIKGGGVLHKIFATRVQHPKINWTQSYLSFCKNEESKVLKSMKKGSIGLKIKGKLITKNA